MTSQDLQNAALLELNDEQRCDSCGIEVPKPERYCGRCEENNQPSPCRQVDRWVYEQGLDAIDVARKIATSGTAQQAALLAVLYVETVRNCVDLDSHERDTIVATFIAELGS